MWKRSSLTIWVVLVAGCLFAQEREFPAGVAIIHQVQFRGADHIPVAEKQNLAATLQSAPWEGANWLPAASEKVRSFWQHHGYFRAQVTPSAAELPGSTAEAASFDVTFAVDEGPQYRLGGIAFPASATVFTPQELRAFIAVADGEILDSSRVLAGFDSIRDAYAQRGYAQFRLDPNFGFDEKRHLLYLNIQLTEGKPYHLGKVEVTGPDASLVETLRSRFPLRRGDLYDSTRVDAFYRDNALLLRGSCASCTSVKMDERSGVIDVSIDLSRRRKPTER
jgi:outer membrane protein assembly factor BamA